MQNAKQVMLKNVRLAFPVLNKPESFQGTGEPCYSAVLLLEPKSDNHKAALKAMRAAAAEKWGEAKADAAVKALSAKLKTAVGDGNQKTDASGNVYDGFEDMIFVSCRNRSNLPPRLVDGQKNELPRDTPMIYPGCYVNASVEFWPQANQYGKRLNCQVRGVQFCRDGDSFGAGTVAAPDEFDVIEGAEDDGAFDDAPAEEALDEEFV